MCVQPSPNVSPTIPGKTKAHRVSGSPSGFLHTHTQRHKQKLTPQELNKTEEREREKETEMLLNSFIVQMNENHINASGQGRASVSELTQQLREEANEGRGSVWR